MPIGAFCSTEEIWQCMMHPNPFIHTTTTGGGALACSAAIAAIHVTLRDKLWEMAAAKGDYLIPKLKALAEKYPQIYREVTGRGLLIGNHFQTPEIGYNVSAELFKRGVLVAGTLINSQTMRIEPPLVITYEQIDSFLDRLEDALRFISRNMPTNRGASIH